MKKTIQERPTKDLSGGYQPTDKLDTSNPPKREIDTPSPIKVFAKSKISSEGLHLGRFYEVVQTLSFEDGLYIVILYDGKLKVIAANSFY